MVPTYAVQGLFLFLLHTDLIILLVQWWNKMFDHYTNFFTSSDVVSPDISQKLTLVKE